jgi:hypothetical protein
MFEMHFSFKDILIVVIPRLSYLQVPLETPCERRQRLWRLELPHSFVRMRNPSALHLGI